MKVKDLLKFIPKEELEFLAAETKVDFQVKKLDGSAMFQLLLYTMLHYNEASLRVMEKFYNSASFKTLANTGDQTTKYNSIRDRIVNINAEFFEKIFYSLFDKFSKYFNEQDAIQRYDSTMVAIASKLVDWGMRVGSKTDKKQIKYTIGLKGSFPCHVEIFKNKEALCEDLTIPQAIFNSKEKDRGIIVFDRGVNKRKTFVKLSKENLRFVTRINTNVSYEVITRQTAIPIDITSTVTIEEDLLIKFMNKERKEDDPEFRLLKAKINATGEPIYFVSNILDIDAYQIAAIYKQRWQIEVFFKFLKQQLNLSHFISRNENAIRVNIYMTLIVSILIIAYQKLNKTKGYKITKLQMANDLESDLIAQIVVLCGGNPQLFFKNEDSSP